MVAVVEACHGFARLFGSEVVVFAQLFQFGFEIVGYLLPGEAANLVITLVHTDIVQLVEVAEDADLAEFGDACQ